MAKLRTSTEKNPILQEEALAFLNSHPEVVFEVQKVAIPVKLTKAKEGETVHTITLARDGRTINETTNTAQEGFGIDTRTCIDGSLDQYAKKPAKVTGNYVLDDGRSFDDLAVGESVGATTVREKEPRKAFVAEEDMYLATTWGEIQFVARGGLVTFSGDEAIGNNNPCDMVLHTANGNGDVVLTSHSRLIKSDASSKDLKLPDGAKRFLAVTKEEDGKNPYMAEMNSLLTSLSFGLKRAKAEIVFALRGRAPELKDSRDVVLASTPDNPLSQEEARTYMQMNPGAVFEVEKIEIPVKLTKAQDGQEVHTITLARDGRTIAETTNTTQEGFGIDTRTCIDGSLDQYAKKPAKVTSGYTLDDGRSFDDLAVGETVAAHTKGREVRKAFVAPRDLYLDTTWGEVQFVAKGGIVTFSGKPGEEEAIGNNNPCDMVIHTPNGNGSVVLTEPASEVRNDLQKLGLDISAGTEKFLSVAHAEDVKSPYVSTWREVVAGMKMGMRALQSKLGLSRKKSVAQEEAAQKEEPKKAKKASTGKTKSTKAKKDTNERD